MPDLRESQDAPPLGSWASLYTLVAVLAVLVMVLLWMLTATFQIEATG